MTVAADNKRRVVLPSAEPGDLFEVESSVDGRLILTRLGPVQPRRARVRFEKEDGYTVGVTDQPISEEAVRVALADFT